MVPYEFFVNILEYSHHKERKKSAYHIRIYGTKYMCELKIFK
jgi:hypothetical protein